MRTSVADLKRFLVWILLILPAFLTAGCSYRPLFSPGDINRAVSITETRRTIEIRPHSAEISETGLLFYPGGLVDSHVYNEILSRFAEEAGILTVVVKMPSNLAVLDIDAGIDVVADYPEIESWVISGHSLGGSMAASTVKRNPSVYEGLIFMDSYPADGDSLKSWQGAVLSIYSSIEKISDPVRMQKTLDLIPPAIWLSSTERNYPAEKIGYSVIHQIDGGSHSYFGTYGPQDRDYQPTIERDVFHAETVDYMIEFFTKNGWR